MSEFDRTLLQTIEVKKWALKHYHLGARVARMKAYSNKIKFQRQQINMPESYYTKVCADILKVIDESMIASNEKEIDFYVFNHKLAIHTDLLLAESMKITDTVMNLLEEEKKENKGLPALFFIY